MNTTGNGILGQVQRTIKAVVDSAGEFVQSLEESADLDAVCLPGFGRSFQVDNYSCGAQCAFLVLRYFKKARSIKNVTKELGTTEDGTDQGQILKLLRKRGLKVRCRNKMKIRDLRKAIDAGSPMILCSGDHWVVAYGYSKGAVYIADPSISVRGAFCRWPTEKLKSFWDKSAMTVRKG